MKRIHISEVEEHVEAEYLHNKLPKIDAGQQPGDELLNYHQKLFAPEPESSRWILEQVSYYGTAPAPKKHFVLESGTIKFYCSGCATDFDAHYAGLKYPKCPVCGMRVFVREKGKDESKGCDCDKKGHDCDVHDNDHDEEDTPF
jgi:DNA-directed RNA polymerase subunit RPC12/RpoP